MILDVFFLLWVEGPVLQIVRRTTVSLIKWEYLDYQKDLRKGNAGLGFVPINNIPDTANTVLCKQRWSESFETLIYCGKEKTLSVFFI